MRYPHAQESITGLAVPVSALRTKSGCGIGESVCTPSVHDSTTLRGRLLTDALTTICAIRRAR